MIEIETRIDRGTMSSAMMTATEQNSSFSSPSSSADTAERHSTRPTSTTSSAAVKVSTMQASFAERTATEMEEILSWYKKYEGVERLKKENQQIQSLPHNAMIVADDDGDDGVNNNITSEAESEGSDQQNNEQQEIQVGNDEYVMVKDYHTPTQTTRKSARSISSRKKGGPMLVSVVRSLSKSRKIDEPPPIAIQVSSEDDDDDVSAMTSISPKNNSENSMENINSSTSCLASGDWIDKTPDHKETTGYCDEAQKVLAMLSPTKPDELTEAQTLIKNTEDYVDEEEEVLGLLLSPSSCSSKDVLSLNGARKSPIGHGDDSLSGMSTGEEAQSQIKAADELIRNTQNMAEIIQQLQESSLLPNDESDHDNDDISIYDININNSDDISLSPSYTESLSSIQYSLDARSLKELCEQDASIASLKVRDSPTATTGFQDRLFYRAIVPIFLSVVIGLVLKSINA